MSPFMSASNVFQPLVQHESFRILAFLLPAIGLNLGKLRQVLVHHLQTGIWRVVTIEPKLGVARVVVLAMEILARRFSKKSLGTLEEY